MLNGINILVIPVHLFNKLLISHKSYGNQNVMLLTNTSLTSERNLIPQHTRIATEF